MPGFRSKSTRKRPGMNCYPCGDIITFHLARIIRTVDPDCTEHVWVVDKNTSISLGDLMTDYLRHLEDHLQQIKQNITAK